MKRIGVLGGGQLGRMLALAGIPLGLEFEFYDPAVATPVSGLGRHTRAEWDDVDALDAFARRVDLVTYEFENVPVATVERVKALRPVHPSVDALSTAQDRLSEKTRFEALRIPTNAFRAVDSAEALEAAASEIGLPAVLKTRRMGYDGKGQTVVREAGDWAEIFEGLGGVPCILEAFVEFDRELSLVAVRSATGETRFYPLVENVHRDGILRRTTAPAAAVSEVLQARAEGFMQTLMEALDYVGVVALELFQSGDLLLANEMAPRVHNSGHWTQDGAESSQFENHLRACVGLPLGPTDPVGTTVMLNLIGSVPEVADVFFERGARLHMYGKSERPGRKLGHLNVVRPQAAAAAEIADRIEALLEG